jgi:hypothetical protein
MKGCGPSYESWPHIAVGSDLHLKGPNHALGTQRLESICALGMADFTPTREKGRLKHSCCLALISSEPFL